MSDQASISRRAAIGLLAAGGLGFVVFGPRAERDRLASRGRLVLDYWEKWTGHEGRAMEKIVDRFNQAQDKLYVRYLVTNTIHQKAMIAILGGAPPDLLGLYSFNVPGYSEADALLPLDDLARARGLSLEAYAPGMRRVMVHEQRWTAVVNTGGTLALFWNREIFRACAEGLRRRGLDPERAPRTIEELDRAHEAITQARGGAGGAGPGDPLERVGFLHMEPGWWSWIWGQPFGAKLYDPGTDAFLIDSPESVRGYEWFQSYPRTLGVDRVKKFQAGFGPYGTPQTAFLTGEAAMVVQGPWMANLIKEFKPTLDYGVAPIPMTESLYDPAQPLTCIDTDVIAIPRGARHPEASMEFIAYLQRREHVEELATAHCKGSPLLSVSEEFIAGHPNRGVRLHTEMASSPRAFIAPPTPVWAECKDVFDSAAQDLWALREAPAGRLKKVQAKGAELLAAAQAGKKRRLARAEPGNRAGRTTGLTSGLTFGLTFGGRA